MPGRTSLNRTTPPASLACDIATPGGDGVSVAVAPGSASPCGSITVTRTNPPDPSTACCEEIATTGLNSSETTTNPAATLRAPARDFIEWCECIAAGRQEPEVDAR